MKTAYKLFRQPFKTMAGIIVVSITVAIFITSVGQFASTILSKENLSDGYSTVATVSDEYYWETTETGKSYHTQIADENAREWAENIAQERKDIFQMEAFAQVYSAYAPELTPDNFSKYENGENMYLFSYNEGNPYRCAILEISMQAVGTVPKEDTIMYQTSDGSWKDYRKSITILCVGTVEKAIGLEQGFSSPVGKTIAFTIKAYSDDELKAMELAVGQRYLIFGMDYSDVKSENGTIMNQVSTYLPLFEEHFGAIEKNPELRTIEDYFKIREQFNCFMSVCDYASLPVMYGDANGRTIREDLREYRYLDGDLLMTAYVSADEFKDKYSVPTIVKLDGTAEEYMQSDEGAIWRQALTDMEISNHGFPVMSVDKLGYQMAFAREDSRITQGRDFTEKERTEGAKVCIISETVAELSDLSVGDKMQLQTYAYDYNIEAQRTDLEGNTNTSFPFAAIYSHAMGFTSEMEEYEIVGIYRQNNAWENVDDPYGFTPNTIFVPKGSITGDARTGTKGIFYTLVLHNGKMEELQELQNEAGYPDLFLCFDQGYSDIVEALSAYEGVSEKAFYIGIAGCAVIMLLFLVLFPLQQGRNLAIMSSLGAPRGKRIGYVVGSSLGILLPGVVIGGMAGALLWKKVAAKLMESVNVLIPMNADTVVLSVSISVALLAIMLLAVTLIAIAISGDRGLSKRK